MSRELKPNSKVILFSDNNLKTFTIEQVKGIGGSCVAYIVSFYESDSIRHKGILKEYCPAFLGDVVRKGNSIVVPEKDQQKFYNGLQAFRKTYKLINNYIAENEEATNYHPVQLGIYSGNNTLYTLSSYDYGKSYDQVEDASVYSIVKLMISVTKAVEMYHNAGFIHCDIKPENIFILNDITELIKLFDYDSLLSITELKSGNISAIPNPSVYYVPELAEQTIRNIGITTDIFEIGAMFYYRLFRAAPTPTHMEHDAEFDFNDVSLMESISPKAKYEIEQLFKNTLQISVRRRYKNTSELLRQFSLILDNLDDKKPFLLNLPVWHPTRVAIERNNELFDIHNRLQNDGFVFIKGMGGIGKSELAKMYVDSFISNYHTIQFCKYVDSIKAMVATMPISGINDEDFDSLDDLFTVKNKILHLCDVNTLIIVDNFNVTYDKRLREFLPSNSKSFKVIFTTRCMPAADYYEKNVLPLAPLSLEDSIRLFYLHNQTVRTLSLDEKIETLVNKIQSNTLLLVLIAKMIKRTGMDINDVILKLSTQELNSIDAKVFYEYDYSDEDIEVYNIINNHLHTVFSISGLSFIEKQTLLNMTLISVYGIKAEEFISACEEKSISNGIIAGLINQGWIENNNKIISLHSIVSDVISEQDIEKENSYYSLACYLQDQCDVDESCHISILQKALAIATQLNRRYKTEDDEAQAIILYLLGSIYLSLYRPKDAEKCLIESIQKLGAVGCRTDLPIVYNKLGEYESKFGTITKAMSYFYDAIHLSEELCAINYDSDDMLMDCISDSMLGIAECYESNNEIQKAVDQYKKLLKHLLSYNTTYAAGVIKDIIRLSEELDNKKDIEYYQELLSDYTNEDDEDNNDIFDPDFGVNTGDYQKARKDYEKFLFDIREEIGEDSPAYKDIAKYRWVYYLLNDEFQEAQMMITDDLSFIESTYGNDSMEMADFLSVLSFQMTDNYRFEYAIELANRAIQICEKNKQTESYIFTKSKLDLMSAYVGIGDAYAAGMVSTEIDYNRFSGKEYISDLIRSSGLILIELGKYEQALSLAEKVIQLKGMDRLSILIALEILVFYYDHKGMIEKSELYLNRINEELDKYETHDYIKNFLVIVYRLNARILSRKADNQKAIEMVNKAISLCNDSRAYIFLQCYQDRGVYYTYLKDYDKAQDDYAKCNEIVKRFNLSEKVNFLLYNNLALIHYNRNEYELAFEYYSKILEIKPDVLNPSNYLEAVICQNYGWVKYNLNDKCEAERLIRLSLAFYDDNGLTDSTECVAARYNITLILSEQGRFEESLPYFNALYPLMKKVQGYDYSTRIYICSGIVLGLIESEQAQKAYDFALGEDDKFAKGYGLTSSERIEFLQNIAGLFKSYGYENAFDFLGLSRELIEKADLEHSITQANQLNYVGVAFLDLYEDYGNAKHYLSEAKALLEELSEQNNPLYELVCNNLTQAEEKAMDDLIKRMVESMTDNE